LVELFLKAQLKRKDLYSDINLNMNMNHGAQRRRIKQMAKHLLASPLLQPFVTCPMPRTP